MKTQSMNRRQLREMSILILVILLGVICLDYLAVTNLVFHSASFKRVFFKGGLIFRALYFLMFSVACWYNSKGIVVAKKKFVIENSIKVSLFIVAFASVAAFLSITSITSEWAIILYPVLFIVANISIGGLILNYVSNDIPNLSQTELVTEKNKSDKPFAISLPAHNGVVNIPNPFRSVLVIGGAGSGKSASIAEPAIYHLVQKKFTGFVYDFKYPTLGNVVYSSFNHFNNTDVKFYPVSFTELDKSYRFNPLDPRFLESQTYVEEYSWALYSNLDKEAIKKGGFFPESAAGVLKAVIWFMKKNHPAYCTLPHVLNLILNCDTKTLVKIICSDNETKGMMKSVKEAAEKEAYDQLAGVMGSLTMQLQKINTLEINWVLSGKDFTIDLNNPNNPKCVVLGSHPTVRNALSPIIAFISTIALKVMNQQGKQHSVALIDEGSTLYIPNLDEIPATARSNKLSVFYMAQDFSQMDAMYGKERRMALISNLATQFYGNVAGLDTAKYVSDIIGKEYRMVESINTGLSSSDSGDSQSRGRNFSEQNREIVKTQEILSLPTGTFIGRLVESESPWFKARMKRIEDFDTSFQLTPIPSFVEDFQLDDFETKELDANRVLLEKHPSYFNDLHIDIENLYENMQAQKISKENFIEQTVLIIAGERLNKKKNKILMDNFVRIQSEADSIINMYK